MKLLRLKITDSNGFRSLQEGFECQFRREWDLQEEQGFAPFVCAGRNGSGKSNLLEVLAAIFYHMECVYLENRPRNFDFEEQENPGGFRGEQAIPNGFEIEYLIKRPKELTIEDDHIRILISKIPDESPQWHIWNKSQDSWEKIEDFEERQKIGTGRVFRRSLFPNYILGYSSGENEILSLPFFKMRFIQFDEYWQALKQQLRYPGRPESRLVYLDSGFSQAILLCNMLFQDAEALAPYRKDIGIEELKEFRIIIRRSIPVQTEFAKNFGLENPAIIKDSETDQYTVNLIRLLEVDKKLELELQQDENNLSTRYKKYGSPISRLKNCATTWYEDEESDALYLDYCVNAATSEAFKANFSNSPLELFQAFQVLLTLNLYSVSDNLKADLYQSDSHYVNETVPVLASDERIMRFKFVKFRKTDVAEPVMLKNLSDGEHQLLHTLGLCLLFKNTQSLFLLDEPETHFNPDWRANFVTRLRQSLNVKNNNDDKNNYDDYEMLITTHTPFLISDSKREKVLEFKKNNGTVSVKTAGYNTLGASINKITMNTFDKRETIGGHAQLMLDKLRQRFEQGEDKEQLIAEIDRLGDSVEKMLLIKTIYDSMKEQG